MKFPEVSSLHVLWRKCRTCSCSCTLFFHRRSFLPRWPLAFLIFSPPLQNFMLFLQQKVCVACYEKKKKQHLIYETTIYRYSKRHTDTKKSIDIRIWANDRNVSQSRHNYVFDTKIIVQLDILSHSDELMWLDPVFL